MLDYEEIKFLEIKKNLNYCASNFRDKDFAIKIKKYCQKFGIKEEDIIKRLKAKDLITLSIFAKDPNKQNFYEKTAAKYIKNINGVYHFISLPTTGQNTKFAYKDSIISKSKWDQINVNNIPKPKSIDFQWKFKVKTTQFYAFHKYIKESGGAQDNQFNDIVYAILNAQNKTSKTKHKILFICDGDYFTEDKLNKLKAMIKNKNHIILSINELKNYLMKI